MANGAQIDPHATSEEVVFRNHDVAVPRASCQVYSRGVTREDVSRDSDAAEEVTARQRPSSLNLSIQNTGIETLFPETVMLLEPTMRIPEALLATVELSTRPLVTLEKLMARMLTSPSWT